LVGLAVRPAFVLEAGTTKIKSRTARYLRGAMLRSRGDKGECEITQCHVPALQTADVTDPAKSNCGACLRAGLVAALALAAFASL